MANYQNLKSAISAAIRTNGNQEITGQVLQDVLNSIVSVIGANYTFAGVATPATNPGTPDQNVMYLAMEGGTYTNFNGTVLLAGISLLMWNGSWTSETVMYSDGGVFDISVYKSSGGTLATYADLSAALDGGNNIPASARKGGMSVKFVCSSDNKYVQFRYMDTSTATADFTNINNWIENNSVEQDIAELSFIPTTPLNSSVTAEDWKLTGNGLCSQDEDYQLVKYLVNEGDVLMLNIAKDSNGVIQFQSAASVPSTGTNIYLVGYPYTNVVNGMIKVPSGATYLIVSQYKTNTSNTIQKMVGVDDVPTADSDNLVKSGGIIVSDSNIILTSRASITFEDNNSITIGNGFMFLRKGNNSLGTIEHQETTYTFAANDFLVWDIPTRTIQKVTTLSPRQVILVYYDNQQKLASGLLIELSKTNSNTTGNIRGNYELTENSITFKEGSQILLRQPSIILSKDFSSDTTFTFSTYSYLCINKKDYSVGIRVPRIDDIILLGWDTISGFFGGALLLAIQNNIHSDWCASCRASVKLVNSDTVKISQGYISLRRNSSYLKTIYLASDTTYNMSGSKMLAYNLQTGALRVVSSLNTFDLNLLYHDDISGFVSGLLFKDIANQAKDYGNWVVISRAEISFSEKSVTIGNGDIYIRRNYEIGYTINHTTNTYTFLNNQSSWLVFNLSSKVISVKGNLGKYDLALLYYDGQLERISEGLLYYYYQDSLIAASNYLPKFVTDASKQTFGRVRNYMGIDSFLIGFITDVHSLASDKVTYKHIGYLNKLNDLYGFDILVNNGDIGTDSYGHVDTEEDVTVILNNTKEGMCTTSPWLYVKGNHERYLPLSLLGAVFARPLRQQLPNVHFGDSNGMYGYMDMEKDVRIVFLNTSDAPVSVHYDMSTSQLNWFVNTLNSTPNNYNVVVLSHLCVHPIGGWIGGTGYTATPVPTTVRGILEGYANKTSGNNSDTGISWDFTNANGKLVCILSGDSHFNNFIKENGVNYIVRQGYALAPVEAVPEGATMDTTNPNKQCIFDVFVIKDSSNAKIFRIGSGGSSRDLAITF